MVHLPMGQEKRDKSRDLRTFSQLASRLVYLTSRVAYGPLQNKRGESKLFSLLSGAVGKRILSLCQWPIHHAIAQKGVV